MKEIWKDIKGFENLYQVSNYGKIKNSRNNKLLKTQKNIKNYVVITLKNKEKKYTLKVHRLVAQAFIENLLNKPQVNHIDGNKENNYVDNLEWVNNSENQYHAYKIGLKKRKIGIYREQLKSANEKRSIKIRDNFNNVYFSIREASRKNNVTQWQIKTSLMKRKKINGKIYYLEKEEVE